MEIFKISHKSNLVILALGAESAGNFSVYENGLIHFSENFGDLLDENNFKIFRKKIASFLTDSKLVPNIIISDLHPLFHTTNLAQELAKKYNAQHLPMQHHLAHIFSAVGDEIISTPKNRTPRNFLGIACDGTGYGLDEKIWGGEIFKLKNSNGGFEIVRIGHLENQLMIGGEMAIKEPARMIISILSKFLSKSETHGNTKKYYSKNEFDLFWNQLGQNFNCLETSSTARILDAASVILGFSKNERASKHGPTEMLEKNSTKPYALKPTVEFDKTEKMWILKTTSLFEYLIKNINRDKHRLAATAQKYIADGLSEIIKLTTKNYQAGAIYFSGGMANNEIMSSILESHGAYVSKKIPRGDAGISLGQTFLFLLAYPRDQLALGHFDRTKTS